MDILSLWYDSMMAIVKPYPALQAAIVTILSGSAMGVVGFALIKMPRAVANFFREQCLTTLVFNTASSGWSDYNQLQYIAFIKWFSKNRWFGWSRTITFDSDGCQKETSVGPGLGKHFFIHGWRLFIFSIVEMDSQGTSTQKYKVSLSCVGRSKQPLYAVMEEFMVKPNRENEISIYRSGKDGWRWVTYAKKRPLHSVIMSPELEADLLGSLTDFVNDEQWYRERGLNYKQTYLLYGPPGTGKTSLCRALASHLGRDLYILDLAYGIDLLTLLQTAKGGVVIIEDIDGSAAAKSRTGQPNEIAKAVLKPMSAEEPIGVPSGDSNSGIENMMSMWGDIGLSELLNALDGVVGLDDVIIFATTNHPEKLDAALIRDGRVDYRIPVNYLGSPEVKRYVNLFYPDHHISNDIVFPSLPGSTVQKLFMENKNNPEAFVNNLLIATPPTP